MNRRIVLLFCCVIGGLSAMAQLPVIKVISVRGRSIVSFQNQYPKLLSITLERSNDSTKNYIAIATLNSPKKGENAIADEHPLVGKNFYRLRIFFDKEMEWYSNRLGVEVNATDLQNTDTVSVTSKDGGVEPVVQIKEEVPTEFVYVPSAHVFSNTFTGHINIKLPDAKSKRYSLSFFNADKKRVLHIDRISNPDVILDKRNINYKGIMNFSLEESGVEIEKGFVNLK
jgi:formylmethanofuran dehydrogenase subunit D